MTYNYVKHDQCVLRTKAGRPPIGVEIFVPSQGWKAYPEPAGGDPGQSSIAAWFEGTPMEEADALAATEG